MSTKDQIFNKRKKDIVGTNRAERRRLEKDLKNKINVIDKFTPAQIKIIDELLAEREFEAEKRGVNTAFKLVEKHNNIIEVCLKAYLFMNGLKTNKNDIEVAIADLADLINDYDLKNGLEGEKEMADIKNVEEVIAVCKNLLQGTKADKENLEELFFKFPKVSKSGLTNIYQEVKEEIQISNAVEYTLEEPKPQKPQRKSRLKIKRMVMAGDYDSYEIEESHVHLINADLSFKNLTELNKFKQEKVKELNDFVDEVSEALSMRK